MLTVHSVKLINSWATDTVYFIIVMITMLLTFKKLDKVIWAIDGWSKTAQCLGTRS